MSLGAMVQDYDGETIFVKDQDALKAQTLIWAAGVSGKAIEGLNEYVVKGGRLKVDHFNRLDGKENIYVIGDIAYMEEDAFPHGHPQVAQVAIQQGNNLANNFKKKNLNS